MPGCSGILPAFVPEDVVWSGPFQCTRTAVQNNYTLIQALLLIGPPHPTAVLLNIKDQISKLYKSQNQFPFKVIKITFMVVKYFWNLMKAPIVKQVNISKLLYYILVEIIYLLKLMNRNGPVNDNIGCWKWILDSDIEGEIISNRSCKNQMSQS